MTITVQKVLPGVESHESLTLGDGFPTCCEKPSGSYSSQLNSSRQHPEQGLALLA